MNHLRPLCSPATIIAILALVIAAGSGSAYATMKISGKALIDNSVQGRKIQPQAVTRAKLAPGARVPNTIVRTVTKMGVGPVEARCRSGERAISGGGNAMGMWLNEPIKNSAGRPVGWRVQGQYPEGWGRPAEGADPADPVVVVDPAATAHVICARM